MKRSKFFNLNWRDLFKGFIVAFLTALLSFLYDVIASAVEPDFLLILKKVGLIAAASFIAYLLKNLATNSEGEMLTKEPEPGK